MARYAPLLFIPAMKRVNAVSAGSAGFEKPVSDLTGGFSFTTAFLVVSPLPVPEVLPPQDIKETTKPVKKNNLMVKTGGKFSCFLFQNN